MSSEASSEQLCVRKGAGYDEVYLSGKDDLSTSYDERVPSANPPSEKENEDSDVDVDVDRLESGTSEDSNSEENVENAESPIQLSLVLTVLGSSFFPLCGQSMTLI